MYKTSLFFAAVLFLSLLSAPSYAKSDQSQLDELIQEAQKRNPDIAEAERKWEAARERIPQAYALADPMGSYYFMGADIETMTGPEMNRYMISQELPFPGKLLEKGGAAADEARAAAQEYIAQKRDVTNKITRAYYELCLTDVSIKIAEETKELLMRVENVAQSRYAAKGGSQRDVAKAQAEISMVMERLYTLEQQRKNTVAMINSMLNRAQDEQIETDGEHAAKPELKYSLEELLILANRSRQEIKKEEFMVSKERRMKNLAAMEYIPNLTMGFEYSRIGNGMTDSPEDGKDAWMIPFTINIPLWINRINPGISEAKKNLEASQAKLTGMKNTVIYEVKDAFYRYQSAIKIVELYETGLIPQAELALNADIAGYESGEKDFLNLLDSERVLLNAKLTYHRMLTDAIISYADIMRAIGGNIE